MAERQETPAKKKKRNPRNDELQDMQEKFCEYIIKLGKKRKAEAAKLAGYKTPSVDANRLLKLDKVNKRISELTAKVYEEATKKAKEEAKNGTFVANGQGIDYMPGILIEELRVQKPIADKAEIMRFKTALIRGEIKDQFGLDLTARDRSTAANDLWKMLDIEDDAKKKDVGQGLGVLVIEPVYGAPAGDEDE